MHYLPLLLGAGRGEHWLLAISGGNVVYVLEVVYQCRGFAGEEDGVLGLVHWVDIPKATKVPFGRGQELGRGDERCSGFVVEAGRRLHEEGAGRAPVGLNIGFSLRRPFEGEQKGGEEAVAWVFHRANVAAIGALCSKEGKPSVVLADEDEEILASYFTACLGTWSL